MGDLRDPYSVPASPPIRLKQGAGRRFFLQGPQDRYAEEPGRMWGEARFLAFFIAHFALSRTANVHASFLVVATLAYAKAQRRCQVLTSA
jgi:hypothetical protein